MNPKEVKPDRSSSPAELTVEREVNLCCKVPESWRRHWAAEAKRNGVTMTEVIMAAFTAKFGLPENLDRSTPDK